jgi:hypothetical protein
MRSIAVIVVFALSGCLVTTTESEKPPAQGQEQSQEQQAPTANADQPPRRQVQAPRCAAVGETCGTGSDCCGDSFCFSYTYAPPTCRPILPDGASCLDDNECQSSSCVGSVCGATCTNLGTPCEGDADCCPGSFCYDYTYEPVVCRAALADGSHCLEDRHCASANCANYACAP